jgi:DNA (cytosine-5)-methyltransferase 1
MLQGLIVDSFAGGGGASTGIEWALGRSPDIAINHDEAALAMHAANHPGTVHLRENVWKVDPVAATAGKPVALLWASPDCRHHSKAKGGAPVSRSVRGLADVVLLWAETVSPQMIFLENVEEWRQWGPLAEDGKPCPHRKGSEFARWVRRLEALGYSVEWRELRACDYGAPTIRKRLFLVARRDGKPILWPAPTHGAPASDDVKGGRKLPWRTAAQIIDWHLPCPSIFLTRAQAKAQGIQVVRPLAAKTLSRIARGFKRYVLDRADPFIVTCNHGGDEFRGQGLGEPFKTVAAARDAHGLVTPFVSHAQQGGRSRPADAPLHTVCASAKDQNQIVTPYLAGVGGRMGQSGERPVDKPYHTVCTKPDTVIVAPHLMTMRNSGKPFTAADEPAHTVTAGGAGLAAVSGFLVPRYGEREGQEPRSREVERPMPVVVPTGNGGDLAAVYLAQHNTDMVGHDVREPVSTIVGRGCTQAPVMAYLSALQNNTVRGDRDEPLGTVLADGNHHAAVTPFLTAYYGQGEGAGHDEPARTVTTHDRFGHVEGACDLPPLDDARIDRARQVAAFLRSEGVWDGPGEFVTVGAFIVWDIGMRMLTPRELARAQGFPDTYILAAPLPAGGTLTETAQRHKIGNSVCPHAAQAVLRANAIDALALPDVKRRRRAPLPVWAGLPPAAAQPSFLQAAE